MHISLWKFDFMKHDDGWFVAWDQIIKFEWRFKK